MFYLRKRKSLSTTQQKPKKCISCKMTIVRCNFKVLPNTFPFYPNNETLLEEKYWLYYIQYSELFHIKLDLNHTWYLDEFR